MRVSWFWVLVAASLVFAACDDKPSASDTMAPGDSELSDGEADLPGDGDTDTETSDMPDATDTAVDIVLTFTPEEEARLEAFCGADWRNIEQQVAEVMARTSTAQKINLMAGSGALPMLGLWPSPSLFMEGFEGYQMVDGPRGASRFLGPATAFPVGMARGASWDPELERAVGVAIAREARAYGANVLLAPTVNVLRHPRWGRAQETYGEDPVHIGAMGVAFVQGVQGEGVIASVKHLAVNSIENTRFTVNVELDERTLREVYLPHFKRIVQDAQVGSVMSAYNSVNGAWASENFHLLTEILRQEWGFLGFVESDWFVATHNTADAANAGLDIEMPSAKVFGSDLRAAVESGAVSEDIIDAAVRRILRVELCFAVDAPPLPGAEVIESPEHLALARQAAVRSMVLLRNENQALPIQRGAIQPSGSLVVVGALADVPNIGDLGSSAVAPSAVITPLAGIRAAAGVTVHPVLTDTPSIEDDVLIGNADVAIVVVGLTDQDEGEGSIAAGDRAMLGLRAEQMALIEHVATLNSRVVVVLEGGSAIAMDPWIANVQAVVMAWYPGVEGGAALADLLFGDANFAGRLPIVFPATEADTVPFDNVGDEVFYDYLHGYRFIDDQGRDPLFPFGFGLSYTSFVFDGLSLSTNTIAADGSVDITVDVTNNGAVAGIETVQLYVSYPSSMVERAPVDLKTFARVELDPGQTASVTLNLSAAELAYFDEDTGGWVVEATDYTVHVGQHSRDLDLQATLSVQ